MVDTRFNYRDEERNAKGQFVSKAQPAPFHAGGWPMPPRPQPPVGTLTVSFFGEQITLTGGPYRSKPDSMFGVKMAAEIDHPFDVSIPTQDFQTPPREAMYEGLLSTVLGHFVFGDPIYVGCMAGKGRTGMFLATLAYMSGEDDPVSFVRAHYYPHAVETRDQEKFVKSFDRTTFRRQLMKLLIEYNAVSWGRLRKMPWQDKLLYLRCVFAK